jgi:hypothetical protein
MNKILFAAALALFGADMASANLVSNGSFEADTVSGTYVANGFEYMNRPLTGWNVYSSRRGVILFDAVYQPVADGLNAVQLEYPTDSLSQTFATVVGQAYQLSYALSAYNDGSGAYTGGLQVNVGNASQFVSTTTNQFAAQSLSFVATSTQTTLMFTSVGVYNQNYPQLDNISVNAVTAAVPEPETYALALAGLGAVAFMRRRRA